MRWCEISNLQATGICRSYRGVVWYGGCGDGADAETVQMRITWSEEVLGLQDVEQAMDGFERNLRWTVDGKNW